jgi:glutamate-ammonia-ligase adenylyltransferase
VQLLQMQHADRLPELRTTRTLEALTAATKSGLLDAADAAALENGWRSASRVRNALTLVRGKASDQLPRQGPDLAAVARILRRNEDAAAQPEPGYGQSEPGSVQPDPGEFLDEYLRVARRARQAVERIFEG